jgi:UDP-N-acetylglucosamine 2-epimerase (non-hydrolysing)
LTKSTIAFVFGTRPEAIKMAPLIQELKRRNRPTFVAVTAQHRSLLDGVLSTFNLKPDLDLNLMQAGQSISEICSKAISGLNSTFSKNKFGAVLVHGDTTTTIAAAIAAYYNQIPIGHVEAGLRTNDLANPFPEEGNRRIVASIARWHFCPTAISQKNLLNEGIDPSHVHVTGNTGIDALLGSLEQSRSRGCPHGIPSIDGRLLLVTAHRRESFGFGIENICKALVDLVNRFSDLRVVFPVHPNPNVREPVKRLINHPRIHVVEPQDYLDFIWLMDKSYILLTDSGGLQEEGPSLGKPVLVARMVTERPEAISAGTVRLVGTNRENIVSEVSRLLNDPQAYISMAHAVNPYGDGLASQRIADLLEKNVP